MPDGTSIVVNATSIGLPPDITACPPLHFDTLNAGVVVADVIPNPPRTVFLRRAEERGCRTLDGLGMLVNQGVAGVRLWTGLTPKRAVMEEKLKEIFSV